MKFYPILGAQAISQKQGNSFRVWTIAKAIDREGSGYVTRVALCARLTRIGRADSTISKMISQAISKGWVERHEWRTGCLSLKSPGKIARLLGCYEVGNNVEMHERLLFTPGWKANVWAGVESLFDGRQIAVVKLHELTGINPRAQARYRKLARIKTKSNYAKSKLSASHVPGLKAAGRAALPMGNKAGWRLPDTRFAARFIERCAKGRTRKNNQEARKLLCNEARDTKTVTRLFYDDLRAARKSKAREVYYLAFEKPAFNLHAVIG